MDRKKKNIISVLMTLLFIGSGAAHSEHTSYSIGFVPQQAAKELTEKWEPIIRYIRGATGIQLELRTAPDIPMFEERLKEETYDFVFMNPIHYTVFSVTSGYRAFAKQKHKLIRGILVVREDSDIKDISELAGETLAFPAPAAFAASLLPRGALAAKGISFTPKYVGSHDSVYFGVARGHFIAGGGIRRTLSTVDPELRKLLREVWVTEGYTPHAFAAHSRVPHENVKAVQEALVEMIADPIGQTLLEVVGFHDGIEVAADPDWDDVRSLGFIELPK